MAQTEPRTDAMSQQRIVLNEYNFNDATEYIFKSMARSRGVAGRGSFLVDGWEEGQPEKMEITLAALRNILHEQLINVDNLVKQQVATGNNVIPVYDPDGPNEIKLPGCKCVNPPSNGFCLLGGCLFGSVGWGKGEVSFTFNI